MTWSRRQVVWGGVALALARPAFAQDQRLGDGVVLTAFDSGSLSIPTVVFEPVAGRPLSGAGVLLLHGGGGANIDVPRFYRHAAGYAQQGLFVAMPNYFAGTPEAGEVTRTMTQRFRDVVADGARWLATRPGISPDRLALMGYSRGGHLAVEAAVTTAEVRAAVGIASAGGLEAGAVRRRPQVMLIHSSGDPVVRPRFTRRWAETLRQADVPVAVQQLDSPRHIFEEAEWSQIFGSARSFLSRHLAA